MKTEVVVKGESRPEPIRNITGNDVPEGYFFATDVGTGGAGLYVRIGIRIFAAWNPEFRQSYSIEARVYGYREVKRVEITYVL